MDSILRLVCPDTVIQRLAVCPHCWQKDTVPTEAKTVFHVDVLVTKFTTGESFIKCGEVPVFLDGIAPDVCMSYVPLIGVEEIQSKVRKQFYLVYLCS